MVRVWVGDFKSKDIGLHKIETGGVNVAGRLQLIGGFPVERHQSAPVTLGVGGKDSGVMIAAHSAARAWP